MLMEDLSKHSYLMRDDTTDKDGKLETMMDYVISWTLRMAQDSRRTEDTKLYEYSRAILGKLLGNRKLDDSTIVESVKVRKQHFNIDLWVDVELLCNGVNERYAILIENKAYTYPHFSRDEDGEYRSQLCVYKKKFDRECDEMSIENRHYVLITCFEDDGNLSQLRSICSEYDFVVLSLTEIQNNEDADTKSDLFNNFWLRYW